jgi:Trypsin-like peptidase domain
MASVPQVLKEHVAALCAKLPGSDLATFQGTCFFVQVANSQGRQFDYLVTAKHVRDALAKAGGGAYLRINRGHVGEFNQGIIDLAIPTEGWLVHEDPNVDLAALEVAFPPSASEDSSGDVFRYLKVNLDTLGLLRPQEMRWPPLEGEDIFFIGMTSQFQGEATNLPTVRRGAIALVSDQPLVGMFGPSEYYVVEAQVYPGNSGSPVWVVYKDAGATLGVLAFAFPVEEEIRRSLEGGINVYHNFGLSLVVPIEKVTEMLNSDKERERREMVGGPPLSV